MDWELPAEAQALRATLTTWSDRRLERIGTLAVYEPDAWAQLAEIGLLRVEREGGTLLDEAAGFMAATRAGLPEPLLEADLALAASDEAVTVSEYGGLVTSAGPGAGGESLVAWGAVADLVVDQITGSVLGRGPLPPASVAGHRPHGWVQRAQSFDDPLAARRWCLGSALLVGLGRGMLELAVEHAKNRHQFGRLIGSFQAVQFRLAECLQLLESAERSAIDAAWRLSLGKPEGTASAALAWLWAEEASARVSRHCHQIYGALGFCDEVGLVRLSIDALWLRASIGRRAAARWVVDHRQRRSDVPSSTVLGGFEIP